MKKLSMFVVFIIIISASLFAGDWVKTSGSSAVDVAVAENGFVAVANTKGDVFTSKDLGKTWTKSPTASDVTRISLSSDASIMGAVNKQGSLFISRDMGASWVKTGASSVIDASVGRSHSFVVNKDGGVYFTASNDFANWTKTEGGSDIKCVVFGGPFIFVSNSKGDTFIADFNKTPKMSYRKTTGSSVVDLDVAPNGNLWVANKDGNVFSSPDKGTTWKKESGSDVKAISLCNKYTIVANKNGDVFVRDN